MLQTIYDLVRMLFYILFTLRLLLIKHNCKVLKKHPNIEVEAVHNDGTVFKP